VIVMMNPGITRAGSGVQNLSWNILGQTYVPKQLSANSHASSRGLGMTRRSRRDNPETP
jgi:hypothetical protein